MQKKFDESKKIELSCLIADNLPVFRAKLGITQQELADRIGITRNTLTTFERKKKKLSWCYFVSLYLIFSMNQETKLLMDSLSIHSVELEKYFLFKHD